MLVEQTLFGENDKIAKSIERIKFASKMAEKQGLGALYVAFSGGKDSVCMAELCKMAGVPYELHYNITTIDPPEVMEFMRENYPELHWHLPEQSMMSLIIEKHMPPTRIARFCCAELKERGGQGRMCLTGVRWAESVRRKNTRKPFEQFSSERMLFNDNDDERRQFEHCALKGKFVVNPIIDWADDDVWEFIHNRKLPYCKLYDMGFKRIGCIGCPNGTTKHREFEFARYPKMKELYIKTFDKMLAEMPDDTNRSWKTGEDVFNWWLYGEENKSNDKQIKIEGLGDLIQQLTPTLM